MRYPAIVAILVVFVFSLASCASDSLAGVYVSADSELLKIKRDSAVFWSPPSKTQPESSDFRFIGILGGSSSLHERTLIMPSSHPYFGTTLTASPDGQSITMDWRNFRGHKIKGLAEIFLKHSGHGEKSLPQSE